MKKTKDIISQENKFLRLCGDNYRDKIKKKIFIDSFLYAPIEKNESVGRIEYTLGGKLLYKCNIVAGEKIKSDKKSVSIFSAIGNLFS